MSTYYALNVYGVRSGHHTTVLVLEFWNREMCCAIRSSKSRSIEVDEEELGEYGFLHKMST